MSERSRRVIQRFDYKVYNKTGKKVCKAASSELVIMGDLIEEELKISCKIKRVLNEFELELLYDIEDIEGGIKEFRDVIESYENVHVMLRRKLGGEYGETYEEYGSNMKKLNDWVRNAKVEIKRIKKEKVKEQSEKSLNKEKEGLKAEVRLFSERMRREIQNMRGDLYYRYP